MDIITLHTLLQSELREKETFFMLHFFGFPFCVVQ